MTAAGALDEGVIKFDLVYARTPALPPRRLRELVVWRDLLWRLSLVGQDPERYGGAGFGNLSRRLRAEASGAEPRFAITGTQTGALSRVDEDDFAIVTACDAEHNRVYAEGPVAPSSESLTHDMLYRVDASIGFVFHVHSPEIWQARAALKLPTTAANVPYGTPAMAAEILRLKQAGAFTRQRVLAMAGHEDGVIAFGRTAEQTGVALVRTLARAMAIR